MGNSQSSPSSGTSSKYRSSSSSRPIPARAPRHRFHVEDKDFVDTNPNGDSRDITLVTSRLKHVQKFRDIFGGHEADVQSAGRSEGISSDSYSHWSVEVGDRNNEIGVDKNGLVYAKTMKSWAPEKTRRILSRQKVGTTTMTDAEIWESNEMVAEDLRVYDKKHKNCQAGSKRLLRYIGDQHIDVDSRQTATSGYARAAENILGELDNLSSPLKIPRSTAAVRREQVQRHLAAEESAYEARTSLPKQWIYLQPPRR